MPGAAGANAGQPSPSWGAGMPLTIESTRTECNKHRTTCRAASTTYSTVLINSMVLTRRDRLDLAGVLWSWHACERCRSNQSCPSPDSCPSSRLLKLDAYFQAIFSTLGRLDFESDSESIDVVRTGRIGTLCRELRSRTAVARHVVLRELFLPAAGSRPAGTTVDPEQLLDVLVKVVFLVGCSGQSLESIQDLEGASFRLAWRTQASLSQFFTEAFPMYDHPGVSEKGTAVVASLGARQLKKRAGLSFVPTNDLRNHLRLDRKSGEVEIFHQTAFLKEHLRLTLNEPSDLEMGEYLAR